MEKANISIAIEKCAECTSCQLICSFTYTGSFNPEKSCLVINPPDEIRFTEECRDGCSLCTRYCEFGAITRVRGV
jgi:Fe-S-cluster-containing hydrogenase component 2